jgi:DnaJ-class molecular chaperone
MPTCTVCNGTGKIPTKGGGEIDCTNCGGTGDTTMDPRD